MKSLDNVGITFVNTLIGRGIFNGVINLSFSAFNFTPTEDGQVNVDPVIACRLRMDKVCATQTRDALNDLINAIERAETEAANGSEKPQVEGLVPPSEKMN